MSFENLINDAPAGRVFSGQASLADVEVLNKALTAGYGTDVAGLTGGGSFRTQSLDRTMKSIVQENKHFALFNKLPKPKVTATVDEWTEQSGVGGFLGGSTNTELGIIQDATGEYARRVGFVKYLMTKRSVSIVSSVQGGIVSAQATEQRSGAKQLLTDAEFLSFEGDSDVVPTEFDGIYKQVSALGSSDHIIDAKGQSLLSVDAMADAAAVISGFGNYGTPTDLFVSPLVGADMDKNLDPAYRVPLASGQEAKIGTPVRGIVTAQGDIAVNRDIFVRDEKMMVPFELRGGEHAAIAAANLFKPSAVTASATDDAVDSAFEEKHAGNYYYAVTGINKDGQTSVVKSAQVAVAAGKKVVLTITASATNKETGYVIYRSRKNGTDNTNDFREMCRIKRDGSGTTTYVDLNRDLPGTSKAYLLDMLGADDAIAWKQFLPMFRFELATVNQPAINWAQMLFGYLQLAKRQQHVVIKNILPAKSVWRPFD